MYGIPSINRVFHRMGRSHQQMSVLEQSWGSTGAERTWDPTSLSWDL